MVYISTQKPTEPTEQRMSLDELKQGLLELALEGTERITRSELVKMLTTIGNTLTTIEANQVLSLIPTVNGLIEVPLLIKELEESTE